MSLCSCVNLLFCYAHAQNMLLFAYSKITCTCIRKIWILKHYVYI